MEADHTNGDITTEVRLALVLNGGVSLAVWMGGVTHELDLLRRASHPDSGRKGVRGLLRRASAPNFDRKGARDAEARVLRIWRKITQEANARIVIDTVAGTSAGGLNGLLLATALGRGAALPPLREVWEKSASLEELLAPPSQTSLLNGGHFKEKIEEQLDRIKAPPKEQLRRIKGEASPREPISLFVTATALDGRSRSYTDAFGAQFEVRDHRRVYRFECDDDAEAYKKNSDGTWDFVKDRKDDFTEANNSALAEAARATAGYPVAFSPVSEQPMMPFRQWPHPAFDDPASCVIDGGVLNNAPFEPVLESITKRRLDKPVRRVVLYVVPSSGHSVQESVGDTPSDNISFLTAALNAIQYPSEADFRSGTQQLSARLGTRIRDTQQELFGRMHKRPLKEGEPVINGSPLTDHVRGAAEMLLDEYRLSRAAAVLWETRKRLADAATVTSLVAMPESDSAAIAEILGSSPNWSPGYKNPRALTNPDLEQWHWGLVPAQRLCEILSNHLHKCLRRPDMKGDEKKQRALIEGAEYISRQLRKALALTEAVKTQLRAHHEPGVQLSDQQVSDLMHRVFEELNVPARVGGIVTKASTSYVAAMDQAGLGNGMQSKDVVRDCLSVEVLTGVYAGASKIVEAPTPAFEFLRLGPDTISRLFNEDRFVSLGERKLYGIRFKHFGAFIDRDWRKSDFAWGRLDAAHHLLSLLIPDEDERREREIELHEAILAAEAPNDLNPRKWMEDHLNTLKGSDKQLFATPVVQDSLRGVSHAALRLLEGAGLPWRNLVHYARPAMARKAGKGDKRWVRWLTVYVRHKTWAAYNEMVKNENGEPSDIPKAFATSVRRTAVGTSLLLVILGAAAGASVRGRRRP
jgi:patatin-related protein